MAEENTERYTIPQLRDLAVRLNNPEVPLEDRQRALTSLFVEMCDRVGELYKGTGSAIKRISEGLDSLLDGPPAEGEAPPAPPVAPVNAGGTPAPIPPPEVAATQQRPNRPQRRVVSAMQPPAAPPAPSTLPALEVTAPPAPPPNGDLGQMAAQMNGLADVPVLPSAAKG